MSFQNQKEVLLSNPKNLFLVDGMGALVSAFLLGIVLVKFENHFGIPLPMLYLLALLACLFFIYDLYCFTRIKKNGTGYLKFIAYLNTSYCFIVLGLAVFHYEKITYIGWTYIFLEILIVASLANLEYRTADNIKNR